VQQQQRWPILAWPVKLNANAPGSFMIQMIDALYTITPEALEAGCKIEEN
jgi:hydroxyethylthiazole kinase-like sugar kinase family protein